MIRVERYAPEHRRGWDDFLARSRNGTFLFRRDYVEYHADRFTDHSLLFLDDDRLVGLLPASERDGTLTSHGGLTYGGVVSDGRMRTPLMLELFDGLVEYLRGRGVGRLVYKAVPHIYHRVPAEEDLYALFRHGGRLFRRDVASTVWMRDREPLSKGRKWSVKRARSNGLTVARSHDFATFMAIEEAHLLEKYGVRPTHTAAEMELLVGRFPENIKLFAAHRGTEMLGGVVVYESPRVAHAQYIAATAAGRELGALDLILDLLLNETYAGLDYFDFGISTEDGGKTLNVGLVENKESYGARAVAYDFYELDLRN
jgi:Acetyltransferase (GNAT) domain